MILRKTKGNTTRTRMKGKKTHGICGNFEETGKEPTNVITKDLRTAH